MAIQNKDELEHLVKKSEKVLEELKSREKRDNTAIYRAEVEVRKWKNLLGGNEKQADIDTKALVDETIHGKDPAEREALSANAGLTAADQDPKPDEVKPADKPAAKPATKPEDK